MRNGWSDSMDEQRQITICLPARLLQAIDSAAQAEHLSRNACMERALAWYLVNIHRREVFSQMRQGYREMAGLNLTLAEESLPLECECESMDASVEILTWSRQTR